MTPLGPRIGKHDVRDGNAIGREEVADGIAELEPEHAQVVQPGPGRALLDFADASEQTFHRKQVDLRMLLRIGQGKAAVARAEIELDRMVIAEKLPPIETPADIGDPDEMFENITH